MTTKKAAPSKKAAPAAKPKPVAKSKAAPKATVAGKPIEQAVPSNEALKQIALLAKQQLELQEEEKHVEEALADVKKRLLKISDDALPNAMNEAHLASLTLDDGRTISVKDEVSLNIPKDEAATALFNWLEEHGFGSLIKRNVIVALGRTDEKTLVKLTAALDKMKLDFTTQNSIHVGTAKAFIKEQLDKKKDVPLEMFGAYCYQHARIK